MTSPGAAVAHMFRRHQHLYGTPVETLGTWRLTTATTPASTRNAVMQHADHDGGLPQLPLHRRAAAAARLLPDQRRRRLHHRHVGGARAGPASSRRCTSSSMSMAGDFDHQYTVDDFFYDACRWWRRTSSPARTSASAISTCAEIYDNFTPTLLFTLEGLGLRAQGESGALGDAGAHRPERRAADEHVGRAHERELHAGLGPAGRGRAPDARRVRRTPGGGRAHALYACAAPISSALLLRR